MRLKKKFNFQIIKLIRQYYLLKKQTIRCDYILIIENLIK